MSYELAQFYAAEIVSGIEYTHGKGIYHRDLKPENIILDEKMHLKIVKLLFQSKDKFPFLRLKLQIEITIFDKLFIF